MSTYRPCKKSLAQNDSNYNAKAFLRSYCLNSIAPFRSQSGFRLRCTHAHTHIPFNLVIVARVVALCNFCVAFFELTHKAHTHSEMCEEQKKSFVESGSPSITKHYSLRFEICLWWNAIRVAKIPFKRLTTKEREKNILSTVFQAITS